MKLIYVCPGNVSVLESQVLELLKYLHKKGISVSLLQGIKNNREQNIILNKIKNYPDIDVHWVRNYPTYRIFENITFKNFYIALKKIPDWRNAIIHVRDCTLGVIFKRMLQKYNLKNRLIIDLRGIDPIEAQYKKEHSNLTYRFLFSLQCRYAQKTYKRLFDNRLHDQIAISSVSKGIDEYIKKHYPKCSYKRTIHPNIAGSLMQFDKKGREKIRAKFGLKNDDVIAICATGGGGIWQKDKDIINKLLQIGIKVINLSKHPIDIEGCISTFIPFSEMPAFLSAADAGILWRENLPFNNTASPSKLSEFAATGLFIIHNGSVHIANDYIKQSKAGIILESPNDISQTLIKTIKEQNREQNCISGQTMFGISAVGNSYIKLYESLK